MSYSVGLPPRVLSGRGWFMKKLITLMERGLGMVRTLQGYIRLECACLPFVAYLLE